MSGTRPELPVKVIPEKIHVNCVLYVTHNNGETQPFTRECENENLQALFLGILYEVKKCVIQKTISLSLSVPFSCLFSGETCCRIHIKFGMERLNNIFYQI